MVPGGFPPRPTRSVYLLGGFFFYPPQLWNVQPKAQQEWVKYPISCHRFLFIPLETSENFWFSDVFRGYRKKTGMKRVNLLYISIKGASITL